MNSPRHQLVPEPRGSRHSDLNQPLSHYPRLLMGRPREMLVNSVSQTQCSHTKRRSHPSKPTRLSITICPSHCHILFILITSLMVSMSIRISQTALTSVIGQNNKFRPRYFDSRGPSMPFQTSRHTDPRSQSNDRITRQSSNETDRPTIKRDTNKLALIQTQLADLKRQLEIELRVAAADGHEPQVALGSACLRSADCKKAISNSHCNSDSYTCTCLPHHIQYNSTSCLTASLIGFSCLIDAQCQQKVANSVCSNGRCDCAENLVPYRRDKCLQPSKVNDYCLSDRQCQINDRHSFCKWKIPHVYGTCKCPPNYKIVDQVGNATLTGLRCVPRLGDTCLSDEECLIATRDSVCAEGEKSQLNSHSTDHGRVLTSAGAARDQRIALILGDGWPTSGASSRRCRCARGSTAAPNRLDCVRVTGDSVGASSPPPTTTTQKPPPNTSPASGGSNHATDDIDSKASASSLTNSKHHYEMIGAASTEANMDVVTGGGPRGDNSSLGGGDKQAPTTRAPLPHIQELDIKILAANDADGPRHQSARPEQAEHQITRKEPNKVAQNDSASTSAPPPPPPTTTGGPATTKTTPTTTTSAPSSVALVSDVKQLLQDVVYKNQSVAALSDLAGHLEHKMSSLGKACRTNQECQLRDTHSHCKEGICECLNPTARCRASSTGCHKDTFQCRNGQCISWYFVCDRFKNCDDGSDEDECRPYSCPPEAFQCKSDGVCLTRGRICDGRRDCKDGSDEQLCGAADSSDEITAQQTNTKSTEMPLSFNPMSGVRNTTSENSSTPILASAKRCHPHAFTCDDGQCLPAYVFCNAVKDCADESDENEALCDRIIWPGKRKWQQLASSTSTTTSTTSRRPALGSFDDGSSIGHLSVPTSGTTSVLQTTNRPDKAIATSRDRQVVIGPSDESPVVRTDRAAIEQLLASLAHRTPERRGGGGSSNNAPASRSQVSHRRSRLLKEHQAQPRQQSAPRRQQILIQECPRDAFTCRNGRCRSSAILCSGVDGCGDNSDEDQCEVCQCQPAHN